MDDKNIKLQRLNIDLPKETIEIMKEYSKYFSGCKRKNKGSAALFARKAISKLINGLLNERDEALKCLDKNNIKPTNP